MERLATVNPQPGPAPAGEGSWPSRPVRGGRTWIFIAVLGILSIAFRLVRIGQESFWADEVWSLFSIQQGVFHWIWNIESTPPLFFLLLKGWGMIFGHSHVALRAFSATAGGVAVPALYYCARRWRLDRAAATAAALIMAVHPFAYWQSQQNRYYAILMLLGILWLAAVPALMERGRRRMIHWPFCLMGFACFATHYYFALYALGVGAGLLGWWLLARRDGRSLARLVINFALMGLLMFTLLPLFLHQRAHTPAGFLPPPSYDQLLSVFRAIYWAGVWISIGPWRWPFSWRIWLILLLSAASLIGYGCRLTRAARRRGGDEAGEAGGERGIGFVDGQVLLAAFLLPTLAAFYISRKLTPIFIADRYTILFLPAFVLWLCAGWSLWPRLARKGMLALAVLAMGALGLGTITHYWTTYQEFDWCGAIRKVDAEWREGDAAVFCPNWNVANYTNNGGVPRSVIGSTNIAALERAKRVWLFVWEQAPESDGRLKLQQWRASRKHTPLITLPQMTLTLVENGPAAGGVKR